MIVQQGVPGNPEPFFKAHSGAERVPAHHAPGARRGRPSCQSVEADDGTFACLLVDQFEELFSFARRNPGSQAEIFVDVLVGLQAEPPPGLHVIVTMRSEFLGACARYAGLAEAINETQYLLPRMEHGALLRAICEPARLFRGEVQRALAQWLIGDAGAGQDHLPLLQHGLMLLDQRHVAADKQARSGAG